PATHTLSLHDALPIYLLRAGLAEGAGVGARDGPVLLLRHLGHAQVEVLRQLHRMARLLGGEGVRLVLRRAHHEGAGLDAHEAHRSEEHTSELQSPYDL